MVWSGYAVLMSEKTDSIKLNNILGCLPGSTFVYSEVFKLDISLASHILEIALSSPFCSLRIKSKDKDRGIMGLVAVGPAGLWRCWPRQSSTWCISGMLQCYPRQVAVVVAAEVPVWVLDQPEHPHRLQEHPKPL
ncbi:hypothetical protein Tco_0650265 [Tanacetum coccineum]